MCRCFSLGDFSLRRNGGRIQAFQIPEQLLDSFDAVRRLQRLVAENLYQLAIIQFSEIVVGRSFNKDNRVFGSPSNLVLARRGEGTENSVDTLRQVLHVGRMAGCHESDSLRFAESHESIGYLQVFASICAANKLP